MAAKHARKSPQRKDENDSSQASQETKNVEHAKEILAITDDVLDDIDRALKAACGFGDDESVTTEEFTERAGLFVRNYQQKGGQ